MLIELKVERKKGVSESLTFKPHWHKLKAERGSNLFSGDLLFPTVFAW